MLKTRLCTGVLQRMAPCLRGFNCDSARRLERPRQISRTSFENSVIAWWQRTGRSEGSRCWASCERCVIYRRLTGTRIVPLLVIGIQKFVKLAYTDGSRHLWHITPSQATHRSNHIDASGRWLSQSGAHVRSAQRKVGLRGRQKQ